MRRFKNIAALVLFKPPHKLVKIYSFLIQELYLNGWSRLAYYLSKRCMRLYGVEICLGASIHETVIFKHPMGIVIGGQATLKSNVMIHQNVTIGSKSIDPSTGRGVPSDQIINENVVLGAGCKVLGNITIGKNSIVGANVVVSKNIPSNCVVFKNNKYKKIESDE